MKFDFNFTTRFALRVILEDSNFIYTKEDKALGADVLFISIPFDICYTKTNYNKKKLVTHLFAIELLFFKIGIQIIKSYQVKEDSHHYS
jgi:hypothetical protein